MTMNISWRDQDVIGRRISIVQQPFVFGDKGQGESSKPPLGAEDPLTARIKQLRGDTADTPTPEEKQRVFQYMMEQAKK